MSAHTKLANVHPHYCTQLKGNKVDFHHKLFTYEAREHFRVSKFKKIIFVHIFTYAGVKYFQLFDRFLELRLGLALGRPALLLWREENLQDMLLSAVKFVYLSFKIKFEMGKGQDRELRPAV